MSEGRQRKARRLGELLLEWKLIDQRQLMEACRVQAQSGGRLGSTLVQLKHLSMENLLKGLGEMYGVPAVNLFELEIPSAALVRIPFEQMKRFRALPLDDGNRMVMADPRDMDACRELQFTLGRTIRPLVAPSFQIEAALNYLEKRGAQGGALHGKALVGICESAPKTDRHPDLRQLFRSLMERGGSDLLLVAGAPPSIKKNNELHRLAAPILTPEQVNEYALQLMTQQQREYFQNMRTIDFAITLEDLGRFRVNIYSQRSSLSIAARHIVENIPTLPQLGIPSWMEEFALKSQGLILITGPTGHGKTTTMAALVDIINTKRRRNIITLEDPVEYLHRHKSSNVNQREIGVDTDSFPEGLKYIFREAPDVIVIGEMRDAESFSIALQAADTGHLVISCLHANNAVMAVDRVVDIFPPEQHRQIRNQMAENLLLVLNQRLVPTRDGQRRVLAYERLTNSYRVRNLIREGKEHQIRSLLQQSPDDFHSLDLSLAALVAEGRITSETAQQFSQDSAFLRLLMERGTAALKGARAGATGEAGGSGR